VAHGAANSAAKGNGTISHAWRRQVKSIAFTFVIYENSGRFENKKVFCMINKA